MFASLQIPNFYSQPLHPKVIVWYNRIVQNGGTITDKTLKANNRFINGCLYYNIYDKLRCINTIAPDSFVTARIPLLQGSGSSVWTNVNSSFVAGNLTIDGLVGVPASSTALDTGMTPALTWPADNNAGFSIYMKTTTNTTAFEMGRFANNGNTVQCSTNYSDNKFRGDMYNNSGDELQATINLAGFYSMNRRPGPLFDVSFANSTNAWAVKGTNNVLNASRGTDSNIYVMATATFAGSILQPTDRRVSFVAFHDGLTSTEGQNLFNLADELRRELGGGYV